MIRIARAALLVAFGASLWAGDWTERVHATARDGETLVSCRARLAGEYLLVEVTAADGWHVYAMDNEQRAKEALAGRMSLGVEQNTEILVSGGLERVGDWLQPEPEDFSQPELRWYSFGFEGASLLASRVRRTGPDSATIAVRAQACDSGSCISVEAELELPLGDEPGSAFTPDGLVPVRGT